MRNCFCAGSATAHNLSPDPTCLLLLTSLPYPTDSTILQTLSAWTAPHKSRHLPPTFATAPPPPAPHSFHRFANIIYLDAPALGFSYSQDERNRKVGGWLQQTK